MIREIGEIYKIQLETSEEEEKLEEQANILLMWERCLYCDVFCKPWKGHNRKMKENISFTHGVPSKARYVVWSLMKVVVPMRFLPIWLISLDYQLANSYGPIHFNGLKKEMKYMWPNKPWFLIPLVTFRMKYFVKFYLYMHVICCLVGLGSLMKVLFIMERPIPTPLKSKGKTIP